ncbi:MAG: hypothetical protein ABSG41_24630 [Bryobacteraceae bacterium]
MTLMAWRVCWLGGWDKGRVLFVVMVERVTDTPGMKPPWTAPGRRSGGALAPATSVVPRMPHVAPEEPPSKTKGQPGEEVAHSRHEENQPRRHQNRSIPARMTAGPIHPQKR